MSMSASQKQFTGRHMLISIVTFFSVIIAVNLLMAYLANSTWSGLVVANDYQASQTFDNDLSKSRAQDALGWKVELSHAEGRLRLTFMDGKQQKIDGMTIAGTVKRPTTDREDQSLTFASTGSGVYTAPAVLAPGVWEVEVDAKGGAIPDYKKIFRFIVKG